MSRLEKDSNRLEILSPKIKPANLKLLVVSILIIFSLSKLVFAEQQDSDRTTKASSRQTNGVLSKSLVDSGPDVQRQANDLDQSSTSSRAHLREVPSTSPSITSVHQVWTSASSGRLDELSPEIIGKLRGDVPFLAAYALRPRLVGGSNRVSLEESQPFSNGMARASAAPSTGGANSAPLVLETGASSPQGSTESLVPKLGDFSEFKVETSSSSKSEHHHNRRTSLKRKGDDELRMKKRVLAEVSQLVRKQQRGSKRIRLGSKNKSSDRKKLLASRGREGKGRSYNRSASGRLRKKAALMKSQARVGRLRTKMNRRNLQHHMNIIKHGKYQLANDLDSNEERKESSGFSGTKGGSDFGDTKGGSRPAAKKPFYSKALPEAPTTETDEQADGGEEDRRAQDGGDEKTTSDTNLPGESKGDAPAPGSADKSVNEVEDDVELDKLPGPKRVGDGDVDEEGDTVTVMPKFDGVDDDPEIPDDYEDTADEQSSQEPATGSAEADERNGTEKGDTESPSLDEPRTRRVNRERQNEPPRDREPTSGDDSTQDVGGVDDGTSNLGSGGGIGATVGNPGSQSDSGNPDNDGNEASGVNSDDDNSSGGSGVDGERKVKPGVEFVDEERNGDDDKDDVDRKASRPKKDDDDDTQTDSGDSVGDVGNDDDDTRRKLDSVGKGSEVGREETGEFESKKENSRGRKVATTNDESMTSNDGGHKDASGNDDVDEDSGEPRASSKPSPEEEPSTGQDVDYRDDDGAAKRKVVSESDHPDGQKTGSKSAKEHKSHGGDCDDGSYNHHGDDNHHHHSHHDSIKWLQDAIPGEPNQDYPILSRANVTNFSCSDQKYPGYYADVEARCQVFHICQADGRQDSFLCPNGTIFSQRNYVCVWWNSFDCEDSPKYYDLNGLLYKQSSNKNHQVSPSTDLRPLDGERIGSSSARGLDGAGGVEDSSIDSLIRNMRRNKAGGSNSVPTNGNGMGSYNEGRERRPMDRVGSLRPDDEATIQRKSSSNVDDESSGLVGNSARLRASRAEPRRRRRASVRQAPPKLKSRRVSRNSRRWKIRHRVKPKRRA